MSREIRRTPDDVADWLQGGGWHIASLSRGAPPEDPLVDADLSALRLYFLARLGLTEIEWAALHRRGRPTRDSADARRRFNAGLAAIQASGGSLTLTARILGTCRETVFRAAAEGRRAA